MERFNQWAFLIQEEVAKASSRGNITIPIPERVKELVGTEHLTEGPMVFWNLRQDDKSIILSDNSLRRERYQAAERRKIYDIDDLNGRGGRIRPPNAIAKQWHNVPEPNDRVYFLAHQDMLRGDVKSTYLLTEKQILDLLSQDPNHARNTAESFFEVPAFGHRDG